MRLGQFFVNCSRSLSLLFVDLSPSQPAEGIRIHMNNGTLRDCRAMVANQGKNYSERVSKMRIFDAFSSKFFIFKF